MPLPRLKIRRESVWPLVLAATITWCSGMPAAVPSSDLVEVDKLGHFAAYGALATAIVRHPAVLCWPGLGAWWAFPLASLYGLGDEFRQNLTDFRTYDLMDWAADSIGAFVAVLFYVHWPAYRRWLEMPVWKRRPKTEAGRLAKGDGAQQAQEAQK